MSCPICGEYYFDEEHDAHFCKELDIMICDDCLKKVEENHKVTGKFVVNKCKCCGNITSLEWVQIKSVVAQPGQRTKLNWKRLIGKKGHRNDYQDGQANRNHWRNL